MDLTPQSRGSPTSPFRYMTEPQPQLVYEYPSPKSELKDESTECQREYRICSGPMSRSTVSGGSEAAHSTRLSHSTPNILSADYDPFAPYHPASSAAYSDGIYSSRTAELDVLRASDCPSGSCSQRSSFSSASPSELFAQVGSVQSCTPRVKMEDHQDYTLDGDSMVMGSPQPHHDVFATTTTSYPGSLEAAFYREQSQLGWPKVEYICKDELASVSSSPAPPYERRSESQEHLGGNIQRKGSNTIARTRQPRKLTTKEDANFQCHIPGCGKLFGRSYNFKAHMDTHDTSREYPFPCPLPDCDKRFVRKTDLQRHNQSVHMKQRTHRCDYCSRYFARKDTLRRHMEDGCSKRFDIETVDFVSQDHNNDQPSSSVISGAVDTQCRQSSYSSSARYGAPSGGSARPRERENFFMSNPETFLGRQEFMTEGANEGLNWSD